MFCYKYSDIKGISPKDFFENDLLDFTFKVSEKTGEVCPINNSARRKRGLKPKYLKTAEYHQVKFLITNMKYINFSGSLHEYFNNGANHDDFTFENLFESIQDQYKKLKINPFSDFIHNIEFGVNVVLPCNTKTFLNSIVCFKGKEYERSEYNGTGNMIKFCFNQYELKIYDKGFQFDLPENVLRFEIKVTTMHFLRSKGINIYTSADLLNQEIHKKLGKLLKKFFSQVVIFDSSIDPINFKKREQVILTEGQNPKYWTSLKTNNPENYKKKLIRFRELTNKHSKENIQTTVLKLISDKWDQLCRTDKTTLNQINNWLTEIKPKSNIQLSPI